MNAPKKYRPSNGTEGEYFIAKYCMNCFHCDPDPNGEKQCEILMNTLCYNVNSPHYPEEWIYNEDETPLCTKHKQWNWDEKGNPHDQENPNAPEPFNPNQLLIEF